MTAFYHFLHGMIAKYVDGRGQIERESSFWNAPHVHAGHDWLSLVK